MKQFFSGCEKQFPAFSRCLYYTRYRADRLPRKNEFADLLYRWSTAPVWRRCCVDPLHCKRGEPFFFRYDLFVALVLILFGCFVIFESDLVIAFIPVVIGIILLANGLLSIQKAFNLKKTGLEKWWLEFLLALLTSVLGIIICTNPFDAVATTNIFIGICLVYSGISDLVTTYYMGRAKRRIKNVIQTEINQQKILHDDNVIDVDEDELH